MSLEANIVNTISVSLTPESSSRLTLAQDNHGLSMTFKQMSYQSIEYICELWNEMKLATRNTHLFEVCSVLCTLI
jgi:hypothetical protein